MISRKFNFQPCSATAGKPFERGPKCPLYLKANTYLKLAGWQQIYYNTFKTASGDMCNTKYKRLEKSKDPKMTNEVLSMLEIHIEGSKKTCLMTAVIWTYHPMNILETINHSCETEIMGGFENLFNEDKRHIGSDI